MQVTGDSTIVASNPELGVELTDVEVRNSAALIVEALTGEKKTGESLKHERLSEDLLLAAVTHAQMLKIDTSVADRIIKRIKPNHDKQLREKNNQPIFRAIDEILSVAARGNKKTGKTAKITKTQKQQILNFAFDKAQLDSKNTKLRRKVVEMPAGETKESTNIDRTIDRVKENTTDSASNLRKFRKKINSKPKLTRKQVRRQRRMLDGINPKNIPEDTPPADNTEGTKENTAANDFVPTPNTMTVAPPKTPNDKFEVVVPDYRAEEIVEVGIFASNADTEPVVEMTLSHVDDLGRAHWAAIEDGEKYKEATLIKFKFNDGSYDIRYIDPEKTYHESYSY